MAITATYVSTSSFTVSGDKRLWFVPGRAIRADCGADGVKFGYVNYSSSSSSTSVSLLASESDALTSNLTGVELSVLRPDSVNTGSVPLEDILMLRGFKSGMALEYKDTSSFYVNVGSIHIDDGTYDRIYTVPTKLTKSVTGLSASTWYHIYAQPPTSGLTLTATEITYSTTAPSVDDTKGGKLYHPTDGTKRCVGWFTTRAASTDIRNFNIDNGDLIFVDVFEAVINGTTITTSFQEFTMPTPMGSMRIIAEVNTQVDNTHYFSIKSTGETDIRINAYGGWGHYVLPTDSSKKIKIKVVASSGALYLSLRGIVFPKSL